MKNSINVSLYIVGGNFNPEIVSNLLALEPTDMRKKGDSYISKTGRETVYKHSVWHYSVENESDDVSDHINQLLETVHITPELFTVLQEETNVYVDVLLMTNANAEDREDVCFELVPAQITKLKEYGLYVQFTFAAVND